MRTIWTPDLSQIDGPKYRALLDAVKNALKTGEITEGEKLPPIRELAFQLGMTPATVVRAYQLGIDEGILEARVGDGTYAKSTASKLARNAKISMSFFDAPMEDGYNLRTSSVPRVGQDELFNEIVSDILNEGGFQVTRYTNNQQVRDFKIRLADFLRSEGFERRPEEILITKGATNGSALAASCIALGRGSVNALIEPESYIGFRDLESTGHVSIYSVEVDEEGMMPESLREACAAYRPAMILTSSVAQNPYSTTMSEARMREIIAIAEEFDVQIIDDVIHAHLIKGEWKSFKDFSSDRVWTITSLSKLGYPALQVGLILPPLDQIEGARNYLTAHNIRLNELQRPLVEKLLASPRFYEVIEKTRTEVAERQDMVREVLDGFDFQLAEGAPFFWLRLPSSWPVSRFVAELASRHVRVATADTFAAADAAKQAVRMTLGGPLQREDFARALQIVRDLLLQENYERVV